LRVTKRKGHIQELKPLKLRNRIDRLMAGLDKDYVDVDYVVDKVRAISLFPFLEWVSLCMPNI
jgi:hypothetical protein